MSQFLNKMLTISELTFHELFIVILHTIKIELNTKNINNSIHDGLLERVSSHDASCSDVCETQILEVISLWTKRYDQVLKLRHNAVKKKIWIPVHMNFDKRTHQQDSKIKF